MPVSDRGIRHFVTHHVVKNVHPRIIFDLGCGYGMYGATIRELDPYVVMIGMDIWPAYFAQVQAGVYTALINAAAESIIDKSVVPWGDLILCMDMIEHLEKPRARELLGWLRDCPQKVIVSTPLFDYKQGPWEGNPYEEHKCWFSQEEIVSHGFQPLCYSEVETTGGQQGSIGAFQKGD